MHKENNLQVFPGVIFRETRHQAKAHVTSGALIHHAFPWPREKHRWQHSWVDDFSGQCWLWRLLMCTTFVAAALVPPTNVGLGQSWLFPASSIEFLTRRSLKSRWVYLALHEDKSIQLLNFYW